jgi:hypothetical protein
MQTSFARGLGSSVSCKKLSLQPFQKLSTIYNREQRSARLYVISTGANEASGAERSPTYKKPPEERPLAF